MNVAFQLGVGHGHQVAHHAVPQLVAFGGAEIFGGGITSRGHYVDAGFRHCAVAVYAHFHFEPCNIALGLVNRVVPHEELEAETEKLVQRFIRNSPRIIAMIKQAVYKSLNASFDEMLDYETATQKRCFQIEDSAEGLNAFIEKREPKF